MRCRSGHAFAGAPVAIAARSQAREWPFLAAYGLFFAASAGGTIAWCGSMAGGMPMPGGWTMSMAWMRMPGQTWLAAGAMFMGMWIVMMAAMMTPSLVLMLVRYRAAVRGGDDTRVGVLTAVVALGYFFVWTIVGMAAYPLGVVIAAVAMQSPPLAAAVPLATGAVFVLAGGVQLTAWKSRQLLCCRCAPGAELAPGAAGAWWYGLRLGGHCSRCCSAFMVILLCAGVMDLPVMGVVALAITVERFSPQPARAARLSGLIAIASGVLVVARALRAA